MLLNRSYIPDLLDRGGPAQPLLIVKDLVRHFHLKKNLAETFTRKGKVVRAVDGVSFRVMKGETLGVVGESGCGKSTTARILLRLIEPTAGELIFDGEVVGSPRMPMREYRKRVQMVFQDSYASLNSRLTIEESIAFAPRVHGVDKRRSHARSRELLARVGLDPARFAGRYPHELSGGQRQRVNIALALAPEPRLVILDEAVSALDKSIEAQVLNLLMDLKAEFNLTYIFISHDLHVVRYVSDRVIVMYLGKIAEEAASEKLFEEPLHPYTHALISSMPSMDPGKRTEKAPLFGDPPNPIDPPSGCRFHTRCNRCEAICMEKDPRAEKIGEGRHVACFHRLGGQAFLSEAANS
jgi:peptide/nickel transport system ATP-binding protein